MPLAACPKTTLSAQPKSTPSLTESLATVVVSYGRQLLIETEDGDLLPAIAKGRKLQAVCGDRVHWQTQPDGTSVIKDLAPRHSKLYRHDPRKGRRLLAVNVDRLLIVIAAQPEPDLTLLDCYLIAAENLGIDASLVFNKIDLLTERERRDWQSKLQVYADIGYPQIYCSAKSGRDDVEQIARHLAGACGVLVGQSGVGKSSIINALIPDHAPRTQTLSKGIDAGRHTTTATRLYHLPNHQGQIIDSPGVRDFRLWDITAEELMRGFREFRDYLGQCRFNDCQHRSEPSCAIRDAVSAGGVTQLRYDSYCRLLEQLGLAR